MQQIISYKKIAALNLSQTKHINKEGSFKLW